MFDLSAIRVASPGKLELMSITGPMLALFITVPEFLPCPFLHITNFPKPRISPK